MFGIPFGRTVLKSCHDQSFDTDFKEEAFLASILKLERPLGENEHITTGAIKSIPRMLHWIVSHILRPRSGGHSRLDRADIHLLHILQNKVALNWPNYFVKRMFLMRNN